MINHFSPEIAVQIFTEITSAKKILMHCHPSPDADSMGSTLALKKAIESFDPSKQVTLIKGDSDKPKYLSVLPGYETIVEKNIFEVDLSEYDLFLILDAGSLDQISKHGTISFPASLKTIVIDHHKSNTGYADINLVDTAYPATCQMIFDCLKAWNLPLDKDIAVCLFMGMYTDTGGFRYKPVSSKTLQAAAACAEIAPHYTELLFTMDNSNTKGRLIAHGLLLNSIQTHFNDAVAFAAITHQQLHDHHITIEEISGVNVVNELKSVIGWNICAVFTEMSDKKVKVSMRSRDPVRFDVSKIAFSAGGGGHAAAAGIYIQDSLKNAQDKVLQAIKDTYPELAHSSISQ